MGVRWKARECGQVPIRQLQRDLRRRRERATSKLFVWFDRVMQASCKLHEAKKMEEAMGAVLDRIRENYTDVSRTKLELQEILYDLRNALDELLQARSETLIPRLKYVRRRIARKQILSTVGKAARLASVSAAIPVSIVALPAGIACAGTALGLAAAAPTGEAVEIRRRQKILTKASGDDIVLCNEVVAAARNLAEHVDAIEPLHVFEPPLGGEACCARKLVQSVLDLILDVCRHKNFVRRGI